MTTRVLGILFIIIIPIIASLFIVNYYSIVKVREEIFASNRDILSVYMEQIDYQLKTAKDFLRSVDPDQSYIRDFQSENISDYYYAANKYSTSLVQSIKNYRDMHGFAVYAATTGKSLYAYNDHFYMGIEEREKVIAYIQKMTLDAPLNTTKWQYVKIDGAYYLIYLYPMQETYFCAWTNADSLMKPMRNWKIAENSALLLLHKNKRWNRTEGAEELLVGSLPPENSVTWLLEESSLQGDFKIIEMIDADHATRPFARILYMATVILAFFFVCIPILLHHLNINIFKPMKRMRRGIRAIYQGDFTYKIQTEETDNIEFLSLIHAFNEMVDQIEKGKIRSYEDALEKNRLDLQFLQVQIEPHFYLNALNTVHAMAQMGDTVLIEQLSKHLSEYMRYLSSVKMDPVTIQEEVAHIQNYLQVLRARLGNEFAIHIQIDPVVQNTYIPPLLIQSLVENSMKYAFNAYHETVIHVSAVQAFKGGREGTLIRVYDNGKGYPKDVLSTLNTEKAALPQNRIGLSNAKRRLMYMFGDCATFTARNRENGGAETEIWIPLPERKADEAPNC